ncbi:MAG TPA: MerR family transcriptional regulator [Polyangiaceae bacterium]|nr:MerR family transcriptional regulator [Polyangiaceae bacterium]
MTYRISTVSEMTGVPRNTLIAWERRYGFVRPVRHENGYRSYSEEDVATLLRIQNALGAGLKISEAIELLRSEPPHLGPPPNVETSEAGEAGETSASLELDPFVHDLTEALVSYQGREAERLLLRCAGMPFEQRVHSVFFPVLQRVGDLWAAGRVNVAQEHYASSIIRDQLVSILVAVGTRSPRDPHAACTTFPGEQHELAALALAVHLSLRGFRVSYLGANLPLVDLIDFCRKQRPLLVCVSVIGSFPAHSLENYGSDLRAALTQPSRLVIGGAGVSAMSGLEVPGVEYIPKWQDFSV